MSDYKRITMREFAGVTGDNIYNRLAELEDKIERGELVGAIWFKSWLNGIVCCGRVIGYEDGGFVIESGDNLISAEKIYTSREQAENDKNKNDEDLQF